MTMTTHVTVTLWPWLVIELPREVIEDLSPAELADCCDAARAEVVRLLRLRAGVTPAPDSSGEDIRWKETP